jgi:membrane-bound serine protease (ClpP class)
MWRVLFGTFVVALAVGGCGGLDAPDRAVHLLDYHGNVDPVMERYVDRGLGRAADRNAVAVVLKLNTPGGLLSTTRNILSLVSESPVPVIVWVAPSGAHAASAGTFIAVAAHVATMAPGTNIGAASPVSAGGGDIDETLQQKIENDAVALIRSIAEARGRNADWVEQAVREAVAISAGEAVELNVVDFLAQDLGEVLAGAEGRLVDTPMGPVTLSTAAAPVVENRMTLFERFLSLIADPNIAFLFLSLGGLLLVFGLLNAGTFLPETTGALILVLGFFSLSVIPYSIVGVVLLALGLLLLTLELFVPGTGALGVVGAIALVLGGFFFTSSSDPEFQVSRWVVFVTAGLIASFFIFVIGALLRSRRLPVVSGAPQLIGRQGRATTPLRPEGRVLIQGEIWNATVADGPVDEGQFVTVVGVDGLRLRVTRVPGSSRVRRHR